MDQYPKQVAFTGDMDKFEAWIERNLDENDDIHLENVVAKLRDPITPVITCNHITFQPQFRPPDPYEYIKPAYAPRIRIQTNSAIQSNSAIQLNAPTFPTTRRPVRRALSTDPIDVVIEWFDQCGIQIGSLLPTSSLERV